MNDELAAELDVPQRLEYWTLEFVREIDLALRTVVEAQPYGVVRDITGINDVKQHDDYSKGAIRGNGWLTRTSAQTSSNSGAM
jgi:hypothetical protein